MTDLAQQGVHFRYGELTAGAHRAVAGHGGEQFVAPRGGQLRDAMLAQFADQRAGERRRVAGLEQGRHAAYAELVGAERRDGETQLVQGFGMFLDGRDVERVGREDGRDE